MIEIENGCMRHRTKENTWLYPYSDVTAYLEYQKLLEVEADEGVIEFTSQPHEVPEIGDFIEAGKLVKRTTPKVNNDWSKWRDKEY